MNIKTFKRLIKEAVAEAIYEQLPEALEEYMAKQEKQTLKENKSFNFTSNDIPVMGTSKLPVDVRQSLAAKMGLTPPPQPSLQPKVNENGSVDLSSFIMDAAVNMTAQERAGLSNLG